MKDPNASLLGATWVIAVVATAACDTEAAATQTPPILVSIGVDAGLGLEPGMTPPLADGDELPIVLGYQGLRMAVLVPQLQGAVDSPIDIELSLSASAGIIAAATFTDLDFDATANGWWVYRGLPLIIPFDAVAPVDHRAELLMIASDQHGHRGFVVRSVVLVDGSPVTASPRP